MEILRTVTTFECKIIWKSFVFEVVKRIDCFYLNHLAYKIRIISWLTLNVRQLNNIDCCYLITYFLTIYIQCKHKRIEIIIRFSDVLYLYLGTYKVVYISIKTSYNQSNNIYRVGQWLQWLHNIYIDFVLLRILHVFKFVLLNWWY